MHLPFPFRLLSRRGAIGLLILLLLPPAWLLTAPIIQKERERQAQEKRAEVQREIEREHRRRERAYIIRLHKEYAQRDPNAAAEYFVDWIKWHQKTAWGQKASKPSLSLFDFRSPPPPIPPPEPGED